MRSAIRSKGPVRATLGRALRAGLCCLGTLAVGLAASPGIRSQEKRPDYKNPQLPVEQRVADLLKRMTLEEKVAQTLALWTQKNQILDAKGNFAPEKAKTILGNGLGQIARPSDLWGPNPPPEAPPNRRGPREMAVFTNAVQKFFVENTRLGIPVMFHEEGLHGHAALKGTSFPQPIALGSTWDTELVEEVFAATAAEIRARGAHQVLAPVLDLARDARWGRFEETYSEDPYLVTRLGVACIKGFQGSGPGVDSKHVIATAKHFAVHGQHESGTNVGPGNYSERVIRDQFLAPFEAAIKEAGVMSVMPSYNEIDGIPSHANRWLLEEVLRREWGFQGYIVSDYNAVSQLQTLHRVAGSKEEAARRAFEVGVDIELPDPESYGTLVQQVKDGRVSMATLDTTVARILHAKFSAGLFEDPYVDPEQAERIVNSREHQLLAIEAARKGIILLKNQNNLLPLDRAKLKSIAVIGPNAGQLHLGGYSGDPQQGASILQGIRDKVGAAVKVNYAEGVRITESEPDWWADKVVIGDPALNAKRIPEAVKAASESDVAVIVIGENEQTSREAWADNHLGDRDDINLLGQQEDLVKAVLATGKPTIVFLINGRPLSINYVAENVPAILEGWYLGQGTGTAVADVLFGDVNPSGKLPVTIPRSVGQLPVYYYQKPSARRGYLFTSRDPIFPFGHGLSYTTFKYGNLKLSQNRIGPAGQLTVSVDITNAGKVAGTEVAQLYIRDQVSSVTRPIKELKGFQRVTLNPGQTSTVTFAITPDKLSFLNERMERVVEPGMFDVMVGTSSAQTTTVTFEVIP